MIGKYNVKIYNRRITFEFEITRNITIFQGDSSTGKSTLISMIDDYNNSTSSGVSIETSNQVKCYTLQNNSWETNIKKYKNSIIFIDEGASFLSEDSFAKKVKNSTNYFVIITRQPLYNLPYSINEIYSLNKKPRKKYNQIKRVYNEVFATSIITELNQFDSVIVEDSKSGYKFFKNYFNSLNIKCISANGKSNLYTSIIDNISNNSKILVIGDGAAIGCEINKLNTLNKYSNSNITFIFLESFEWILLKSLFNKSTTKKILLDPYDYIDSSKCFSWEVFFTKHLTEITKDTIYSYKKSSLPTPYTDIRQQKKIINLILESLK